MEDGGGQRAAVIDVKPRPAAFVIGDGEAGKRLGDAAAQFATFFDVIQRPRMGGAGRECCTGDGGGE